MPDDRIFVHRLQGVEVNEILQFNRVLLCGTPGDTLIGRPFLPGVTVRAAVEEHIRDSTVYIYKRRRAKGYRKFRGFRAVRSCKCPAFGAQTGSGATGPVSSAELSVVHDRSGRWSHAEPPLSVQGWRGRRCFRTV